MGPSLAHRVRTEAHAVWLAIRDPRTPLAARIVGVLVAAYALSPIDLIPDFIPVLGLVDDAILIPLGVWLFERLIPPEQFAEHRAAAEEASHRPVSWSGIAIVLGVWALLAWGVWSWLVTTYD
ncbi:YkvA family protein [uncultured Sphingomonas sp.]|uniref:YkvA family protein n=1 Tax=uncultured Sphingomonas sp. TaxID=158754 RepID=UPI0025CE3DCF|nr:YkvA family protein [uncultured Sphingomonas sp.]